MSDNDWLKHRRAAEKAIKKAAIELSIACGGIMPHPEVASMHAAKQVLEGVLELLELTSPEPRGHSKKVVELLKKKRDGGEAGEEYRAWLAGQVAQMGREAGSTTKYRIKTISGRGLPATVDADGYDTELAAQQMAESEHDGEFRVVAYDAE